MARSYKPQEKRVELKLLQGAQWDFFQSEAYAPSMLGGRGSGKTMASAVKGMAWAMRYAGAEGCLTGPTYDVIRTRMLPAIRKVFGELEGVEWEFRRADMEIRFRNGSVIYLRPATDPEKCRGFTLAFFGMDEVAIGQQEESFVHLQISLRQELKDSAGNPVRRQGWVTSTPHWRKPWIKKRWLHHVNPGTGRRLPAEDYPIFRANTEDNYHNGEEFLENLMQTVPGERFKAQELRGEFIDVQGPGFPDFDQRLHVRPAPEGMKVRMRVIGVDFGTTSPTALEEFCLLEDGRIQGTWEFYQRQANEKQIYEALASRPKAHIMVDPSSGGEYGLIKFLNRQGVNARAAPAKDWGLRFRLLGARLAARPAAIFFSPEQRELISEIENLAFAEARNGEVLLDKWEQGALDHGYDALGYALMKLDPALNKVPQLNVRKSLGYGYAT